MTEFKFQFSREALENIAETGADPEQDRADIITGKHSRESLLEHCLDGADDDRREGWEDYVSEIMSTLPH